MDKFTKVKNIGKGNMGACALARNNEDGRYYVIKQVDLAKLNKKERQQSLNEAKVLSSLRHANVINYVDSFLARKSDHLCIVMEYADGGDLSAKVKHSHGANFPQDQVLDWFIQCALALHYIHGKKILHRDVKTQNIFLTQEGVCKLGDFGIARTLSNTFDQANTFVGTPYYLSPELILERPYDYASDVWALGVVLYETMALKHPFNANDMKALMHRILKVQYEPPPHMYTNELRSIVGRLLVKDPQQRMRLSEVFELPIIVRRMQQWMQGGVVPGRYIASLVRHKLLPPSVTGSIPGAGPGGELPAVSPTPTRVSAASAALQQAAAPPMGNDRVSQRLQEEQLKQKQARRDEIREQFRDVKVSKKNPTPPPYHYANNDAPMPSRDPSLLRAEPENNYRRGPMSSAAHAGHQRNLPSLGASPQSNGGGVVGSGYPKRSLQESPVDDRRMGAPAQLPQVLRGNAVPSANPHNYNNPAALPRHMQPSVRGLGGAAAPQSGAAQYGRPIQGSAQSNSDIQSMLEKAAQQRASRQPAPLQPPRRY